MKFDFLTSDDIFSVIDKNRQTLFESYKVGRQEGWSCDSRTKDAICIEVWMRQELTSLHLHEHECRTAIDIFNRFARSEEDLFGLAAQIMNDATSRKINVYRRGHRRWG